MQIHTENTHTQLQADSQGNQRDTDSPVYMNAYMHRNRNTHTDSHTEAPFLKLCNKLIHTIVIRMNYCFSLLRETRLAKEPQ